MNTIKEEWTQEITYNNVCDENGNPTGGDSKSTGVSIDWQNGPLGWDYEKNTFPEGVKPNGAFVETVILHCIQRLQFFQAAANKKFACRENAIALTKLEESLMWLQRRHNNRVVNKVQGEHKA